MAMNCNGHQLREKNVKPNFRHSTVSFRRQFRQSCFFLITSRPLTRLQKIFHDLLFDVIWMFKEGTFTRTPKWERSIQKRTTCSLAPKNLPSLANWQSEIHSTKIEWKLFPALQLFGDCSFVCFTASVDYQILIYTSNEMAFSVNLPYIQINSWSNQTNLPTSRINQRWLFG